MNHLIQHIMSLAKSGETFSDIQIEQGFPVFWRQPTGWVDTGYGVVQAEDMIPLLNAVSREWKTLLSASGSINRTLSYDVVRLRCCAYTTQARTGVALTLRTLPVTAPRLESIGLPAQIDQFASMPKGILLVAGATGAGKTTTIAALVERINETRNAHIVTIEEPIEIVYARKKAIITQREVGDHLDVTSFAQGVNDSLRQCPDVIVVGEIRDSETAEAAFRGAESGHYVMASLHAKSGLGAIQRMLSLFPDDMRASKAATLANTLCGVIFQTILPSADEKQSVVAAEILTKIEGDTIAAISSADQVRQITERMKNNQMPGCIHLNTTLKQLISSGKVTRKAALAASYAPEGLI